MRKRKQPEPDMITLENHLETSWQFRVNLTEADVRRLNDGVVPEWLQKDAEFWCRDNPKASDVNPEYQTYAAEAADAERKSA